MPVVRLIYADDSTLISLVFDKLNLSTESMYENKCSKSLDGDDIVD